VLLHGTLPFNTIILIMFYLMTLVRSILCIRDVRVIRSCACRNDCIVYYSGRSYVLTFRISYKLCNHMHILDTSRLRTFSLFCRWQPQLTQYHYLYCRVLSYQWNYIPCSTRVPAPRMCRTTLCLLPSLYTIVNQLLFCVCAWVVSF
jgi:hypothetical protein